MGAFVYIIVSKAMPLVSPPSSSSSSSPSLALRTAARISAPSSGHARRTFGLRSAAVSLSRQILATTLPAHCCFSQPAGAVTTGSAPRVSVPRLLRVKFRAEHRPDTLELAGGLTGYAARLWRHCEWVRMLPDACPLRSDPATGLRTLRTVTSSDRIVAQLSQFSGTHLFVGSPLAVG